MAHNHIVIPDDDGQAGADAALWRDVAECEQVVFARDRSGRARAILAIHDTRLGPAFGGIRRHRYADLAAGLRDAVALARAMTWKSALAELPTGGGKIVVLDGPDLDRRAAYELVGEQVDRLGGRFHTGPDVGTTLADLEIVATRTRHCATGGHGDLGGSTARGVFAAAVATAAHVGLPLRGLAVMVQGVGAVGRPLCRLFAHAGARLFVADVDGAAAAAVAAECGAQVVAPELALRTECGLFAPCALGGVLDEAAAGALPARAVCGAANNVLASRRAGQLLHARGIPVAPDFVANAGGLVHGVGRELTGALPTAARLDRIGEVVAAILQQSRCDNVPPGELALRLARERVAAAAPQRAAP